MQTRSKAVSVASVESQEECRSMDKIIEEDIMTIESPVTVCSDSPAESSMVCSPPNLDLNVNENLTSVNCDLVTPEPEHIVETLNTDFSPHPNASHLKTGPTNIQDFASSNQLIEGDSDSGDDIYVQRGPICDSCQCYFHNTETHDYAVSKYKPFKIFQCTKCPITVCIRCFQGGGAHRHHSEYLIDTA